MRVEIDGLEPALGEIAFAFFVVRLEVAVDRDGLLDVLRALAPLIPDVDAFIAEFPDQLEGRLQIIAIPWLPPNAGAELRDQAELVDASAAVGVTAAWFFQTGYEPPRQAEVAFPLDDDRDGSLHDFGIAVKLADDELDGENTVLLAFHTLWLAPYRNGYRDTAIAIDREHRVAHLWVSRLDGSEGARAHLAWIAAMLDRVLPIEHARFASHRDDGLVLAGNPLRACHAAGGDASVDAWLADQTSWADDEVARMLCELAEDLANGLEPDHDAFDDGGGGDPTRYAGELLVSRARLGRLDRRALPALLPALPNEPRVAELASVLGNRAAVPSLVDALGSPSATAAAAALGAIGDLAAAPVLGAAMTSAPREVRVAAARALAFGPLAEQLAPARRAEAARAIAELAGEPLAAAAARVLAGEPATELAELLHAELTAVGVDHQDTVQHLCAALDVAAAFPACVRAADLVPLCRFAEPQLRARAHAILDRIDEPLAPAPSFDAVAARELGDDELVDAITRVHVVGRGALIDEAAERGVYAARRSIVGACSEVIARARPGTARLLDHDARVLGAGVAALRAFDPDDDTIALFDRMLRNANVYVKWELLRDPPIDARLIGGMFHVLGERWGWQAGSAKRWLARFEGTPAYIGAHDAAQRRARLDDEETN
jgi:hypothetical protein